jgi:L-malate glycosyltransferase
VGGDRPGLLFVGPMLGAHPGRAVSQPEALATLLAADGYRTRQTSSVRQPLGRAVAVATDMVRWRADFDVVVVAVFSGRAFAYAELASVLGRRFGKTVVLHLHGGALPTFAAAHGRRVDRVLHRADAVVAPSAYLAGAFEGCGLDVRVIPNALPVATYRFREREAVRPRLLWMRAFEDLYRPRLALEVLTRVRSTVPGATLTMAGQDGGELGALQDQVRRMGLTEAVRFPGFLDEEAKRAAFDAHDVVLTTSRVDNMPVSILEAAASGLPVVAFPVGGIPDLLTHDQTALLALDGDPDDMARAVGRLLTEPGLAGRLSRNGRRMAEACDWSVVRGHWDDLLARMHAPARQ